MGPGIYPDDKLVAKWSEEYGTTSVKFYTLILHPENEGFVAAFRELSLSERMFIARIEELNSDAFDLDMMITSQALLWPKLEDFPQPVFAAGELAARIKQYGHGPLTVDEPDTRGIPEHMAADIRNARRAGQRLFEDTSPHRSLYLDLVLSLCVRSGNVDLQLLDYLLRQPLGRLRDLLAATEQVYHLIYTESSKDPKIDKQILRNLYSSPFTGLDQQTEGATVPGFEAKEKSKLQESTSTYSSSGLPPNAPQITAESLTEILEK